MLYLLAVGQVVFPRALVPVVSKILLKPDLQVEGRDMVTSLFQQVKSTAAVDASAQQDCNLQRRARGITPEANCCQLTDSVDMMVTCVRRARTLAEAVCHRAPVTDAAGRPRLRGQRNFSGLSVLESSLSRL